MTISDELAEALIEAAKSLPVAEIKPLPLRLRGPRYRAIPPPWKTEPLSAEETEWLIGILRGDVPV